MPSVRIKENEPFDVALRRFKRSCEKAGVLADVRSKEFYEKPTKNPRVIMADSALSYSSKRTILTQECLRRLRNTKIEPGPEVQKLHLVPNVQQISNLFFLDSGRFPFSKGKQFKDEKKPFRVNLLSFDRSLRSCNIGQGCTQCTNLHVSSQMETTVD